MLFQVFDVATAKRFSAGESLDESQESAERKLRVGKYICKMLLTYSGAKCL